MVKSSAKTINDELVRLLFQRVSALQGPETGEGVDLDEGVEVRGEGRGSRDALLPEPPFNYTHLLWPHS